MDETLITPRLKLTLVTKIEPGSQELDWLHQIRSNEQTTWWSIHPRSKTHEDTQKVMKRYLSAASSEEGEEKTYRVCYAVHQILEPGASPAVSASAPATNGVDVQQQQQHQGQPPIEHDGHATEFIGVVNLGSVGPNSLALPESLTLPAAAAASTLTIELAYMFLPKGWGRGYATEAVAAVLDACRRATSYWAPFAKLYVRGIVNQENPASLRVMDKAGVTKKGVYVWEGEPIWLAGQWTTRSDLHIYGLQLLE